ncbi:hypothetical protein BH11ARM1_BH11ARM1_00450 [soil metagenome]
MPTCTRCGAFSADSHGNCPGCGVALGTQYRAQQDVVRGRNGKILRTFGWIVFVVVLAMVIPPAYHAGYGFFLNRTLDSVKREAMMDCNGPLPDTAYDYQKQQYAKCMDQHSELRDAQAAVDKFNGKAVTSANTTAKPQ